MFNYIKWELKDFFKRYKKSFIALGILMLLVLLSNPDNGAGVIYAIYALAIMALLVLCYIGGAISLTKTYDKKTFLLESMIPLPSKKILLTKYLLGIIINGICWLMAVILLLLIPLKEGSFELVLEIFKGIIEDIDFVIFFKLVIAILLSSIVFMSIIVLCYVISKVILPNKNGTKLVGFILAYIVLYYLFQIFGIKTIDFAIEKYYIFDLVCLGIITICFFITDYLVSNKLEIYSNSND